MLRTFFERSESIFKRDVKDATGLFWFKERCVHRFCSCGNGIANINEPESFTDTWWSEDNGNTFIGNNAFNNPRLSVIGIGFKYFVEG